MKLYVMLLLGLWRPFIVINLRFNGLYKTTLR